MSNDIEKIAEAIASARSGKPLLLHSGRLKPLPKSATIAERLESGSVLMPSGCREWRGKANPKGYGRVCAGGAMVMAHRAAYELAFGAVPAGHYVCHKCDNRSCIEPSHLFSGSNADNVADMVSKGRQARGEGNGQSKLLAAQVLEIRNLIAVGLSQSKIAAQYGVRREAVSKIKTGRCWAHVAQADAQTPAVDQIFQSCADRVMSAWPPAVTSAGAACASAVFWGRE